MQSTAMNQDTQRGRVIAWAARIHAAADEALAARLCVSQLERQVLAARAHADLLRARLARIEGFARRAMPQVRDELARAALGDIIVTARDREPPAHLF